MQLIESILSDAASIAALRRDIHAHPELCFEEQRTSDVIAKALTDWGIPVHRGLGTTGVVGIIKNGSSNRALGLRADIDALPMTERNTFAHASKHPGKMHACGHDGHTAMLLAAAKHLARHRHFDGTPARILGRDGRLPAEDLDRRPDPHRVERGGRHPLRLLAGERDPPRRPFRFHAGDGLLHGGPRIGGNER